MAGPSSEKLDEVKERLLERKRRLWQEVKQQLKSNIGDGYQEMLAAARDEEDQATVSLMAETNLTLLGPKRQELEAIEEALNRVWRAALTGIARSAASPSNRGGWRSCRRRSLPQLHVPSGKAGQGHGALIT